MMGLLIIRTDYRFCLMPLNQIKREKVKDSPLMMSVGIEQYISKWKQQKETEVSINGTISVLYLIN